MSAGAKRSTPRKSSAASEVYKRQGGTNTSSNTADVDPAVTLVNDPLTLTMNTPTTFIEDAAGTVAGATVTTVLSVSDADGDGTFSYAINDTSNHTSIATTS